MPIINIQVTDENVTLKQKQELIAGATQLLVDVLQKDPQTTHVVIDVIPTDNWGFKGLPVTELRKIEKLNYHQK